ncbi:hypothetical protein CF68_08775 [Cupriavidus sp. SK-4]|nr:hypothetical protein CF68_08775 [Cupriavidus sp. SK-4]
MLQHRCQGIERYQAPFGSKEQLLPADIDHSIIRLELALTKPYKELLLLLSKIRPAKGADQQSRLEIHCARIVFWLRSVALALLLVTWGAAGFAGFLSTSLGPAWRIGLLASSVITSIMALASIVVDLVPLVYALWRFRSRDFMRLRREAHHDAEHIDRLRPFGRHTLQQVDLLLKVRIERLQRRFTLFFGGSDKLALFALAGGAWVASKELLSTTNSWQGQILTYGLAFLGGLPLVAYL